MNSLWDGDTAKNYHNDSLEMRVYTSRLIGQEEDLVLHGGGNTSIKIKEQTIFGEEDILYVKGSGWDLATIEAAGFAPVKMRDLLEMVKLEALSDRDMVRYQRAAMTDPEAPNPSVEVILHAIIPFSYVDHTHADAVVTITNTQDGEKRIRDLYGKNMLVIPYVMPGFILAKHIYTMTRDTDWSSLEGMVLMNHGVFTFADQARTSYENMIHVVSKAEQYLKDHGADPEPGKGEGRVDLHQIARVRKSVSLYRGHPVLARLDNSPENTAFSNLPQLEDVSGRGPITPDHVIRTKRTPVLIGDDPETAVDTFADRYRSTFNKFNDGTLTCLDPAPRWAVWPGHGSLSFGRSAKEVDIISDITRHTIKAIQQGELLGGWQPLSEKDLFAMEYWELEQAKLKRGSRTPRLQGRIAVVTGAASGIGKACVAGLIQEGAVVAALDLNPKITSLFEDPNVLGLPCDVTDAAAVKQALEQTVLCFGGIDFLVSNAGTFPPSMKLSEMSQEIWNRSLEINLTSHQALIKLLLPYLELGIDPAILIVGSKNVSAPGPGVSAYSVAKAGLTQLARVAALELGPKGIRVNTIHPDAVYDTALWTGETLAARAKHYGLSVQEYKTRNLLGVEITSKEVADLVVTMLGPVFSKITGAQIPIDGGNERVI